MKETANQRFTVFVPVDAEAGIMALASEEFRKTLTKTGFAPGQIVRLKDATGKNLELLPLSADLRLVDRLCRHLAGLSPM